MEVELSTVWQGNTSKADGRSTCCIYGSQLWQPLYLRERLLQECRLFVQEHPFSELFVWSFFLAMGSAARRGLTSSKKRSYLLATATGLLSSSCCLIQLLLNAFSISCAGFSILNPYRSFFLCLTAGVIIATIWEYGLFTRPTLRTLLIAGVLSASPEAVKLYNEGGIDFFKWERSSGELAVFELEMTGLSCQACANKVKLQIERHEGVVGCDMFLEEMRAVVRSRPGTFTDEAQLEALVVTAGSKYRGKVVKQYHLSSFGGSEDQENLEF